MDAFRLLEGLFFKIIVISVATDIQSFSNFFGNTP